MKAIEVICLASKEILIVFSVRGSYLEHCALMTISDNKEVFQQATLRISLILSYLHCNN